MELNVTQQEVVDLAATKLADSIGDTEHIYSTARQMIEKKVTEMVNGRLKVNVDEFLQKELNRIADAEFERLTEFGEPTGKKISIRSILAEQSKNYWTQKVNCEGKPSDGYGGKERFKWFIETALKSEFENAISTNAKVVVDEFAVQLKDAGSQLVQSNIQKLFKNR